MTRTLTWILAMTLLAGSAGAQVEGIGVAPDWQGSEPSYPPGSLHFGSGNMPQQPVVFRTVWELPAAPEACPVRLQAQDWAYLWVNGQCVYEFDHMPEPRRQMPLEIDIAEYLRSGDNVIAVSCQVSGFALAVQAQRNGQTIDLPSDPRQWRVWKFAPLTLLRETPLVTDVDYAGPSAACRQGGQSVALSAEDARRIVEEQLVREMTETVADIDYESQLLAARGVVVDAGRATVFGGAGNIPEAVVEQARAIGEDCGEARNAIASVRPTNPQRDEALAAAVSLTGNLQMRMDLCDQAVLLGNRLTYLQLADTVIDGGPFAAGLQTLIDHALLRLEAEDYEGCQGALESLGRALDQGEQLARNAWGQPLNELNSAIANKAGWIDDPTLTDSVPGAWGVRFNPSETSWFMDLAGRWRFRLDPENNGLEGRVHEFGYNIANQWPEIDVPGTWEKQGYQQVNENANDQTPCPGVNVRDDGPYNGWVWYRKKILVPAEWAGYDLQLHMGFVDDFDWFYWNGQEIGHTDAITNPDNFWSVERNYTIPKEQVTFGGYNVIAIRVYDCGAGGGIGGGIELRCPALRSSYENRPAVERARTEILSSPMSPAALLTVGEEQLEMFGWDLRSSAGPDGMVLNLEGVPTWRAFEESATVYDAETDGPLSANWVLLWAQPGRSDGELPIQLVFVDAPQRIDVTRTEMGTQQIVVDFGRRDAEVLALRPLRVEGPSDPLDGYVVETCDFWSRAVLAYPVRYAELARPIQGRDELAITDVYDYVTLTDAWGTEPVQLAPLPPLAGFGLEVDARGVSVGDDVVELGLPMGEYGQFRAVVGDSRIEYTVPLDTLPRLGGFTAFCFGPDVGRPGNIPEIAFMAWTGGNTWRPQSNNAGQEIFDTIRWANEAGLNLTFNIDGNLGGRVDAVRYWQTIAEHCKDMPMWAAAYDLINEPAHMTPEVYNPQIARIVEAIREIDQTHMILIETPHSYASIDQFINLEPVDDPAVVYTFHDYDYRLPPRWPKMDTDIRNMFHQWLPAYKYSLEHDAPICISEYGGFEQGNNVFTNDSAPVLLNDFFKVFDQFGFMHHYYSNRGITHIRRDGSWQPSMVHEGYKALFEGDTFYRFRENWHAEVSGQ